MPEIAPTVVEQHCDLVLVDRRFDQEVRWRPGERLHRLFEERCDSLTMSGQGGRLAVDAGPSALSYPRLDSLANQLARFLLARGAGPGDRIGLLFDSGIHNCVALLAVLKIEAAYVPLDAGFPPDRLEFIARDAGVRLLLSMSSLADRITELKDLDVDLVLLDEVATEVDALDHGRLDDAERGAPVDDLAYLIYTSGSTGRPKGVAITHASICNFVRVAAEVYGIGGRDRMYQGLTLAFDFAVEEIWVPWMVGATVVPKPPGGSLLGADLHEFLVERRITAMCCVPTLLATLDSDLPELGFLLVSGEACPADLVTRWHRADRRFLNVYGPTEATVTATWSELHPDRPVTIGVPLPTYSTVILDPDRDRALPPGESGEIGIAGIGLASGYLNRDDLTAKAFIPDFLGLPNNPSGRIYRTGDLARVTGDGEIEYLGRIDTQVKIRGYRIELTEIESVLLGLPGIAQAVVDTVEPEPGVRELVAYYTARADAEPGQLDRQHIASHLRLRLPVYMVPAYFEPLAAIPMTPGDKVDRKALPAPVGPRGVASDLPCVPPSTEMERILAGALAELLRVAEVSVDGDFFADLGADSLVMAKFSAAARGLPGLPPLAMKDIYLNPTVRRLAAALGEPGADRPLPPVPPSASAPVRGSSLGYALCGLAQLVLFFAGAALGGWVLLGGLGWITAGGGGVARIVGRTVAFELAVLVGWTTLAIVAKWLLVGAWTPSEIRLWSAGYLRFWLVKTLIRTSPMAVFTGSPLYVWYLRALGAKIGRGVVIHSVHIPVATDLLTVGDGSVVRRECFFNGYRAINGVIQIGPVTLGRDVHVGEKTVLDVHTTLGDGAELGHTSALQTGQSVPPRRTWHGCPAEPTDTSYRTVPPAEVGTARKVVYSAVHLLAVLLGGAGVMAVLALGSVPGALPLPLTGLLAPETGNLTDPSFYLSTALNSLELFLAGIVLSVLAVTTVPRLLRAFITPGRVYPLYGFHHVVAQAITRLTNAPFLVDLVGDSSAIVHYLRALGYDLCRVEQCGSNFGATIKQDSPFLTRVGTGTMISDHLSVMNMETSGTSFRVSQVSIGERNFLGNNIVFPPGARTGDNVLLASNVMVPIDGPIRENVGLLGSPPFEIPRHVERDDVEGPGDPVESRRRLAAKNRHNAVTAALFLLVRWLQVYVVVLTAELAFDLHDGYGPLAFAAASVLAMVATLAVGVIAERAAWGFRRLTPRFSSIHEPYFWRHERLWKLLAKPMLAGTPFNNILWRLLGVRIGRRVFDDGCSMPEKTLISIGDDAILNVGSTIQCHSLEDGSFKSGHSSIGAHATLGVQAFVHYDVTVGDEAVLDAAAFLMKGEVLPPLEHWQGNPARPTLAVRPGADAVSFSELTVELERMVARPAHATSGPGRKGTVPALLACATAALALVALDRPPVVTEIADPSPTVAAPPAFDAHRPPASTIVGGSRQPEASRVAGGELGRPAEVATTPSSLPARRSGGPGTSAAHESATPDDRARSTKGPRSDRSGQSATERREGVKSSRADKKKAPGGKAEPRGGQLSLTDVVGTIY